MFVIEYTFDHSEYYNLKKGSELETIPQIDKDKFYLVSYLNPDFAKQFNTKDEANDFLKKYNASTLEFKVITLKTAQKKYKNLCDKGIQSHIFDTKNNDLSRKYNGESPDEVFNWWVAYKNLNDGAISYEDYRTWPHLYERFQNLHDVEKYANQTWDKFFITVEMKVSINSDFIVFEKELRKALEVITYLDDDGNKIIPIFDHFLCEGGNKANLIVRNDEYEIEGRFSSEFKSKSLREVFDYWKEHRYY